MIISQNSNDVYYAYTRGRFWRWDESVHVWRESHLLAQKFGKAKTVEKRLTPEAFLTSDEFIPMDDYELPEQMLTALREAKPCKNAPIEPVEELHSPSAQCLDAATAVESQAAASPAAPEGSSPTTETADAVSGSDAPGNATGKNAALSATSGSSLSNPAAPTFDFGADDQTNALLLQDAQTFITGNMARIMAAKHAHDLTANHYQGSWGKWCVAVGISRDTGDNMVRVAEQFGNIQLEGKSILDVQPMKLLYAAAKPSTPEMVKQAVFTGDITTYKEYQELMAQVKAEKERADAAENHEAEAWDMVSKAQSEARATQDKADAVKAERDAALADVQGLTEQNAQLKERADSAEAREEEAWKMQTKAEARAKNAEDALKKQPIVGVTDPEEVQRQADALAAKAKAQARRQIEDAQRRVREAEAKYQKLQQAADGFLAPEQACAQQAKIIADSMRSMYLGWFGLANGTGTPLARMAAPIYQVCDEIRESLEEDTTINPTAAGSEEDAEREALFE